MTYEDDRYTTWRRRFFILPRPAEDAGAWCVGWLWHRVGSSLKGEFDEYRRSAPIRAPRALADGKTECVVKGAPTGADRKDAEVWRQIAEEIYGWFRLAKFGDVAYPVRGSLDAMFNKCKAMGVDAAMQPQRPEDSEEGSSRGAS